MSEEEEIIKKAEYIIKNGQAYQGSITERFIELCHLYQKEKDKNKELEFKNRTRILGKYGEVRLEDLIKDRFTSKDKIKRKIEQIKMNANYDWMYKYDYQDVVKILQELLED